MSEPRAPRPRPSRRERLLLLVALLGPSCAWAAALFGSYVYVPAVCGGAPSWTLYLLTALALVGLVVAGVLSALLWRGRMQPTGTYPVSTTQLGALGLLLAAFFGALMLVQAWPALVIDPCVGLGLPTSGV